MKMLIISAIIILAITLLVKYISADKKPAIRGGQLPVRDASSQRNAALHTINTMSYGFDDDKPTTKNNDHDTQNEGSYSGHSSESSGSDGGGGGGGD